MPTLIHPELSYQVRGAMFETYNILGPLLPEAMYRNALCHELQQRGLRCEMERPFHVSYEGEQVGLYYVDLWVEQGKILIELKVAPQIEPLHQAQAISYLKTTNADLAIVANYGDAAFQDQRLPNYVRGKQAEHCWQPQPFGDWPHADLLTTLHHACSRVHATLGPGFIHQVYRRAVLIELRRQGVGFELVRHLPITYKGQTLGEHPVRLIIPDGRIALAVFALQADDEARRIAQLQAYLRQLRLTVGVLANFHGTKLQFQLVRVKEQQRIGERNE